MKKTPHWHTLQRHACQGRKNAAYTFHVRSQALPEPRALTQHVFQLNTCHAPGAVRKASHAAGDVSVSRTCPRPHRQSTPRPQRVGSSRLLRGSTRQRLPSWIGCHRSVAYCSLVTAVRRGAKTGTINIVKVIENIVFQFEEKIDSLTNLTLCNFLEVKKSTKGLFFSLY